MGDPEYIDILTPTGETLRILYEMTIGDVVIVALLSLLLFYFILAAVIRAIWRL